MNEITDRANLEQQLSDTREKLKKVEGLLKDKGEFRKLEEMIQQLQAAVMLKSSTNYTDDQKELMKELFGAKTTTNENADTDIGDQMNRLKEENNKMYFDLRNGYDKFVDSLKKQRDQMKQLSDFSEALLGIDDSNIGLNLHLMQQKRNKAPLYRNVAPQIQKIQD